MPSLNKTKVNGPQETLIWCLINEYEFYATKVIWDEMVIHSPMQMYGLFFLSLVTWLFRVPRVLEKGHIWEGKVREEISGR